MTKPTLVSIASRTQRLRRPFARETRRARRLQAAIALLAVLASVGAGLVWLRPF